jgi:hypothetical protein
VLGAGDHRHEPHQHPVAHHLRLQAGGAVGVPDRLATVAQGHAYAELVHASSGKVRVDAASTQRIDHAAGPVLVHVVNGNGVPAASSARVATRPIS